MEKETNLIRCVLGLECLAVIPQACLCLGMPPDLYRELYIRMENGKRNSDGSVSIDTMS